ncbi:tRNA lysidine(34) synthetase TilS [Phosphitispora sp. TUW77]|uniref:tRNA lysidine(34) synthetase TilS n=1 Tax=Phosphitispora sp. TUW77 TaxID=3152361 RepID=UPI003AB330BB
MLDQVRATIEKYSMFKPGDRILIGVSGGPDSTALVHVLHSLIDELQIMLYVAHLDHRFRGPESAGDAEFVRELAERLGLKAIIKGEDVAAYASAMNLSAQTAAREIRYRFFEEAAKENCCNKLATGHNANDQAETVLYHFLRGTGPAGLRGIPPVRDGWVTRPLIEVPRNEIEKYCREKKLFARIDSSNLKRVYTRNQIRLELIPLLEKEYNYNLIETLVRTSDIFREEETYLEGITEEYWLEVCLDKDGLIAIDLKKFLEIPGVFQRRIIRRGWSVLTGSVHNITYVHLAAAAEMISHGRTGSVFELPGSIKLEKSYNRINLYRSAVASVIPKFSYQLTVPGVTSIPETGDCIMAEETEGILCSVPSDTDEITIDMDKVTVPLIVRSRNPGDRFSPLGFSGSKKLKKFFIDCKIPRRDRDRYPVLVDSDGQVIWIAGMRADRRWAATPETRRALRLKLVRNVKKQN